MRDIGYLFYAYIADFLKMWIFFWGIYSIPPVKKKKAHIILAVIQIVILIVLSLFRNGYSDLVTLIWTGQLIVIICFYFEGGFIKKIAYSLLAYLISLFLDAGIEALATIMYRDGAAQEKHYALFLLIYNVLNIFTISLISWLKRNIDKSKSPLNISKRIYALLFAGSGAGLFIILALFVRSNEKVPEAIRRVMIVVTIIIVVAYCTTCVMMTVVTESRDNYKALSIINQNIIESQQKYYTLVNEKQQEIRSIRHEMKNHLACIHGLYKANKLQEMEEYINQIIDTSKQAAELFDTGNDIVNAILNDAQNRYKSEHIEIRLEGAFPRELYIVPMDLCVIFANIITNAVEAIQRMERSEEDISYIDVKIKSYKDDLYIDVMNPITKAVEVRNGNLITSKKDKSLHGFGVKNVIQRVEKYHGTYEFKTEQSKFYVEILLKNK